MSEYEAELLGLVGVLLAERALLQKELAERELHREEEHGYFREQARAERDLRTLTGNGAAMKAVRHAIQQVAGTDSTVMILGETGTGKELVARAIHQLSPRRKHLLVAVHCAALGQGTLTSELFGHEKGAFTGAVARRIGRFELAHKGTLFLDEIAELPAATQVMLLRVLQERTIERVGGNQPIPVDVRLIAATHQDLDAAAGAVRFRTDLLYRLNVFPIRVPPLRDRAEDIADLVKHFILQFNRRMQKTVVAVAPNTLRLLRDYHWPGNVRELENLIERAMIVCAGPLLEIDAGWLAKPVPSSADAALAWLDVERRAIQEALQRAHGKIYGRGGAAELLGLKPSTLYGKMKKLGMERNRAGQP
ncbi:MAG: sigma-54 dependent transcriptional regulator [Gemmataceae bacterium]|nr:sigma-54 dependent transcriptional regulator [Gemmataceae bacterium]